MAINTSTTPEEVRRRQRMADQLLADNMGQQKIESWTQGAAQLANVLAGGLINRRAEREATEGREAGNALLARILGGGSASPEIAATTAPSFGSSAPAMQFAPQAAPAQPAAPMTPNARVQNAFAAMEAPQPQQPMGQDPNMIRAGLVQRGLPEHVADGFVMNFQDESGLNPAINERQPMVPGSRGGYGLAQWTGPRRVGLEQFAAQRGAEVSDPNVQLDYLMTELQGPEAGAMQAISQTGNANDAAAAIAQNFLRPAPQNLERRIAEYTGGQRAPANQVAQMGGGMPAQGGGQIDIQALLNDPASQWIDPNIRSALIAQGLKPQQFGFTEVNGQLYRTDPRTGRAEVIAGGANTKAPTTQSIENPDGTKTTLQFVNGAWEPLTAPGLAAPGTASAPRPKLTEQQSKDIGFYNRGAGSLPLIDTYESALLNVGDAAAGSVPGVGNLVTSENYKLGQQAGREFLQSILRKDTGAAITREETAEYGNVFLPQPGDTPPVLEQKRQSRARALEGIRSGLGPAEVLALARPEQQAPAAAPSASPQGMRQTATGVGWSIVP